MKPGGQLASGNYGLEVIVIPIPIGYQEVIVTPKVSRSVEAHWSFSTTDTGRGLVLPDGRCDIIFQYNVHESAKPIPIITGPATQPFIVDYKAGDSWLGVRLRPHHAALVWRDMIVGAADNVLQCEDAIALLPGLAGVNRNDLSMSNLAELCSNFNAPEKVDSRLSKALDVLHLSGGRIRVDELSEQVGCTTRQLNRIFKINVGLTTKIYSQIVQFHRTLKLLQAEQLSISDAAFEGGYSDHAHLTRAFKRFGGFTPSNIPDDLSSPTLLP